MRVTGIGSCELQPPMPVTSYTVFDADFVASAFRQCEFQQCTVVNVGFDDDFGWCILAEIVLWQESAEDLLARRLDGEPGKMIAAAKNLAVAYKDEGDAMHCGF